MLTIDDNIRDKIHKYEYLTSNKRQIIEGDKFSYPPSGEALEKQTKVTEDQEKKQVKATADYGKHLVVYNKLIKKGLKIEKDAIPLEKRKKTFNKLVEEKYFEFKKLKQKLNPNNLIYRYKTEGISPKDFSNYQNLIYLFISLRDGNINPREVIKD